MKTKILITLVFLCTILSCKKDPIEPPPPPPIEDGLKVKDNVVVANDLNLNLLSSETDLIQGIFNYQLNDTDPNLFEVGHILIDTTGQGYLRKITSIENNMDAIQFSTVQASLSDVFYDGEIELNFNGWDAEINGKKAIDNQVKFSGFENEDEVKISAEGINISYGQKDVIQTAAGNVNIGPGTILFNPDLYVQDVFDEEGTITGQRMGLNNSPLNFQTAYGLELNSPSNLSGSKELGIITRDFLFSIIGVPIVATVKLEVQLKGTAGFTGPIQANGDVSGENNLNFNLAWIESETTFTDDSTFDNHVGNATPDGEGSASVTMSAGIKSSVSIYGILTGSLEPKVFANAKAEYDLVNESLCFDLKGGTKLDATVQLNVINNQVTAFSNEYPMNEFFLYNNMGEQLCGQELELANVRDVWDAPGGCVANGLTGSVDDFTFDVAKGIGLIDEDATIIISFAFPTGSSGVFEDDFNSMVIDTVNNTMLWGACIAFGEESTGVILDFQVKTLDDEGKTVYSNHVSKTVVRPAAGYPKMGSGNAITSLR